MRKIAITTLLAGGLLLSAGAFAQGAAQSEPAQPTPAHVMKHETKHEEKMESKHKEMMEQKHEKKMDHKKTWHHKKAMHHEKKAMHHTMKKAAPAPARSGG